MLIDQSDMNAVSQIPQEIDEFSKLQEVLDKINYELPVQYANNQYILTHQY